MLIVCVCPHSFNAKDIIEEAGESRETNARGKIVALVNVITIANIMGRKTIDNKYSTCQNTQQGFKQIISTLLYRDLYVQCQNSKESSLIPLF